MPLGQDNRRSPHEGDWEERMKKKIGTVVFYGMRHGDKEGDALTEKGREQVRRSAEANFKRINFCMAFHSGMERAKQTVEIALETVGLRTLFAEIVDPFPDDGVALLEEPRFGFTWAWDPQAYPIDAELNARDRTTVTVQQWLQSWAPARAIRTEVEATLKHYAWTLANMRPCERLNVLIASHSPTIELAVGRPDRTMSLREADIAIYTVKVYDDGTCRMRSSILRAPY